MSRLFAITLIVFASQLCANPISAGEIVIIVSNELKIKNISKRKLKDLYWGRERFIGNTPVTLLDTSEETQKVFLKKYFNRSLSNYRMLWNKMIFSGRASPPKVINDCKSIIKQVEESSSTIAYIDKDDLEKYQNAKVKVLQVSQ
ncbi:MAG: hypothetical protein HQL32_09830 [Planctomycetes bacterium]|nr:hypothetical protein [Planctomycetota bacterium]